MPIHIAAYIRLIAAKHQIDIVDRLLFLLLVWSVISILILLNWCLLLRLWEIHILAIRGKVTKQTWVCVFSAKRLLLLLAIRRHGSVVLVLLLDLLRRLLLCRLHASKEVERSLRYRLLLLLLLLRRIALVHHIHLLHAISIHILIRVSIISISAHHPSWCGCLELLLHHHLLLVIDHIVVISTPNHVHIALRLLRSHETWKIWHKFRFVFRRRLSWRWVHRFERILLLRLLLLRWNMQGSEINATEKIVSLGWRYLSLWLWLDCCCRSIKRQQIHDVIHICWRFLSFMLFWSAWNIFLWLTAHCARSTTEIKIKVCSCSTLISRTKEIILIFSLSTFGLTLWILMHKPCRLFSLTWGPLLKILLSFSANLFEMFLLLLFFFLFLMLCRHFFEHLYLQG